MVIIIFFNPFVSREYIFENRNEHIECVELLYYPYVYNTDAGWLAFQSLCILEAEEINPFMERLYAIPTKRVLISPSSDYGPYVIRVTYGNGDVEYFGKWHFELVKSGEKTLALGEYCFDGDAFETLFFEYAGEVDFP